jgi:hypothetical protein
MVVLDQRLQITRRALHGLSHSVAANAEHLRELIHRAFRQAVCRLAVAAPMMADALGVSPYGVNTGPRRAFCCIGHGPGGLLGVSSRRALDAFCRVSFGLSWIVRHSSLHCYLKGKRRRGAGRSGPAPAF